MPAMTNTASKPGSSGGVGVAAGFNARHAAHSGFGSHGSSDIPMGSLKVFIIVPSNRLLGVIKI